MSRSTDFVDLIDLAEEKGYGSLYDYAEAAKKAYVDSYGEFPVEFDELTCPAAWLKEWYPQAYSELYWENGKRKGIDNGKD